MTLEITGPHGKVVNFENGMYISSDIKTRFERDSIFSFITTSDNESTVVLAEDEKASNIFSFGQAVSDALFARFDKRVQVNFTLNNLYSSTEVRKYQVRHISTI